MTGYERSRREIFCKQSSTELTACNPPALINPLALTWLTESEENGLNIYWNYSILIYSLQIERVNSANRWQVETLKYLLTTQLLHYTNFGTPLPLLLHISYIVHNRLLRFGGIFQYYAIS